MGFPAQYLTAGKKIRLLIANCQPRTTGCALAPASIRSRTRVDTVARHLPAFYA
jgi:hypothetical protein